MTTINDDHMMEKVTGGICLARFTGFLGRPRSILSMRDAQPQTSSLMPRPLHHLFSNTVYKTPGTEYNLSGARGLAHADQPTPPFNQNAISVYRSRKLRRNPRPVRLWRPRLAGGTSMKTTAAILWLATVLLFIACADDDDNNSPGEDEADDDLADDDNDSAGHNDDDNDNNDTTDDDSGDDESPTEIRIFTTTSHLGYPPPPPLPWWWGTAGWVDLFEYVYDPTFGRWRNVFAETVVNLWFYAHDIWAASRYEVFVVGGAVPFVWWSMRFPHAPQLQAFPGAWFTGAPLHGVWGTSSSDVFAVGGGDDSDVIVHFDGVTWSFMELGEAPGLLDVWGAGPQDVFAVGLNGTIRHYDGELWSGMNSGYGAALRSVHGVSGSDVFAVGESGMVLQHDGAAWERVPFPEGEDLDLCSVWCAGPDELFVIGIEKIGYD
jgi:hypothetical protein